MTLPMKAYALAMYPVCWAVYLAWRFLVAPLAHPGPLYRVSLWPLPYVGMYAYSEGVKEFCRCKPFRKESPNG